MNARYKNPDCDPRGAWQSGDLVASGERSNGHFIVRSPQTGKEFDVPQGKHWVYSQENLLALVADNQIWFGEDGNSFPRKKRFLSDVQDGRTPNTLWLCDEVGHNQTAARELKALFDDNKYFDFPKPVSYIKQMIHLGTKADSIILDFFSGSATTAHAVMQLNAEDGGHRKFIMVQLPEACDEKSEAYKAGYKNICEIGKERIRRAGRKINAEFGMRNGANSECGIRNAELNGVNTGLDNEKVNRIPNSEFRTPNSAFSLDIGFRCLRLDSTNMQDIYYTPDAMPQNLLDYTVDNIKPDRTPDDLLFQVMLDLGIDLSSPIKQIEMDGHKVFDVAEGFLLACFDKGVTTDTVTAIAKQQPYYAIFRDASMADDNTATNFDQIFETYSPATVRKVL